ncbi:MAG: hypothetical protein GXO98_05390 [Nitrospirae bacterium]|nr:hypothetical protein [Nitrospirota bacterium]
MGTYQRIKGLGTILLVQAVILGLFGMGTVKAGQQMVSVAVLDFDVTRSLPNREDVRSVITEGLINALSEKEGIRVVEREKISESLQELKLSAEGKIDRLTALKIGKITGARLIISGKVARISESIIISAHLINTETTQLSAVQVTAEGINRLLPAVDALSKKIVERIAKEEKGILAVPSPEEEMKRQKAEEEKIRNKIAGKHLPRLLIFVTEGHMGRQVPDPAGETAMIRWFTNCGFPVASRIYEGIHVPLPSLENRGEVTLGFTPAGNKGRKIFNLSGRLINKIITGDFTAITDKVKQVADLIIIGEAFSERGTESQGLISSKGRIEVKVVDTRTGKIMMAASKYGAGVDVAERVAGKRALQQAGEELAKELIPIVVDKWEIKLEKRKGW